MKIKFAKYVRRTAAVLGSLGLFFASATSAMAQFTGGTSSSTIALSPDEQTLWIVNQDVNTAIVYYVAGDAFQLLAVIPVGKEPRTLALTPDYAFVTNMVDGTVSVISTLSYQVVSTVTVGVEPYGVAVAPDFSKAYVANASSNTVSVLSTAPPFGVVRTIGNVGLDPRGVAFTADGSRAFVTQFFARFRTGVVPGRDNEKQGLVTAINAVNDTVIGPIILDPMAETGFNANANALDRIAPPGSPPDPTRPPFNFVTGAYPNQLQQIAILGSRAYLPNTAASPNGPVRFNVNTHGFLSVFNASTLQHEPQNTINLNRGIQFETTTPRIFMASPWAIAFKHTPRQPDNVMEGWAVMSASDIAVKVEVDLSTGHPTINAPQAPGDPGNIHRIDVGSAPRGIVISSDDTRAYVMNYVSRDIAVIDLPTETIITRLQAWPLPQPGTLERVVHEGKRLFFTSRGPIFTDDGGRDHFRMSRDAWGSCIACHEDGRDDGVTWIFAAGPRRSVNLAMSFSHAPANRQCSPTEPCADQRYLNWTAIFDEMDDFELNSRTVFGANDPREDNPVLGGLITGVDRITPEITGNIAAFFSAGIPQQNALRPQFEVFDGAQGIRGQNAVARYVQLGVRSRISPIPPDDPAAAAGRDVFDRLACAGCHSGPKWTISRVLTRPPAVADVQGGQFRPVLREVGTFDPNGLNEVNAVAGTPQGAFGFNPPSLLGIFANAGGWFHNSGALALSSLLDGSEGCVGNPADCVHNVSGNTTAQERAALVQFLNSIDESTRTFPTP